MVLSLRNSPISHEQKPFLILVRRNHEKLQECVGHIVDCVSLLWESSR